jgi:threonine 3-dehydrogenase
MKTLVTGAGGQVGHDLLGALRERGADVVATDRQVPLAAAGRWRQLDITDRGAIDAVLAEERPEVIVHLAAMLSARGEQDPQTTYEVNQTGTYHVLEACRAAGVERLIFASSIAVFGPDVPDPTPDDAPLHPTTMYGVTKVAGELLGAYYQKRYGLDFRAIRFPGLISPAQPGGGSSDYALYMYVDGVLRGRYEAFCRPDTRIPLMYMPDGIRALAELAQAPADRLSRCVYNIAAFSPTAEEIAQSVKRAVPGAEITFRSDPRRQAILDSWPHALDDRAAREDWGWRPAYDLEAMTADLIPKVRELAQGESIEAER